MLIGPQGPPWWIFFQNFFKNVLVYPLPTQKYVLWHSKLEKSILGRRELTWNIFDISVSSAFSISAPAPAIIQLHWGRGVLGSVLFTGPRASSPRPKVQTPCVEACRLLYKYWVAVSGQRLQNLSSHVCVLQFVCKFYTYFIRPRRVKH